MRDVMMDWNGVVFNSSMHFFRHGCFSDADFTYPSGNTTVQRMGRMVSMLYTPATSFYHSIIEWVPQWLVLRELLEEHPNILIVMRAAQLQLYNSTLKRIVGVEPAHMNLLVLDWQHRNTLFLAQALYQPVYRCCGRATPTIWRFLRRNFFLPPDGLPIFEPETFRLRRTSPLSYQDITDLLSQREEQQSHHPRRLDVLKPGPVPSLAETFGMTTGLNWVTILVRRPGNLSRNLEESVYERVEGWMRKEFGARRVVVFDGSLHLMEGNAAHILLVNNVTVKTGLPRVDQFLLSHVHIPTPLPLVQAAHILLVNNVTVSKAAHILLVNNVTVKTGLPRVDRFLLPRADWTVHRMKEHGPHGWLPSMLHLLLRMALEPLLPASLLPALLASISPSSLLTPGPLAGGRVEFEGQLNAASDERPMCFQTLVVPGLLKAITFNGMAEEAELVRQRLREVFLTPEGQPVPDIMAASSNGGTGNSSSSSGSSGSGGGGDRHYPDDGSRVRLLYVTRNDTMTTGRRVMHPDSHKALQELFNRMGFEVTMTEYAVLPFSQQLALTDSAEVIVALHGAGLTNPTCFARSDAIVLEISPFGVFYDLYYYTAINAGINYMQYQCTAGPPPAPANDSLYAGMSPMECDKDAAFEKGV
ncbi:unnamed protein product [Closterium sp. Yama58-4]|nr:unnamed protein product [Closterium sp. Yama58-4]